MRHCGFTHKHGSRDIGHCVFTHRMTAMIWDAVILHEEWQPRSAKLCFLHTNWQP